MNCDYFCNVSNKIRRGFCKDLSRTAKDECTHVAYNNFTHLRVATGPSKKNY